MTMLSAAAGTATWSLLEYLIHNGLGHKFAKNRNLFAREHVRHHATTSYFAANWKKVATATVAGALIAPIACAVAGKRRGLSFTAGFLGAYGAYEGLHRRVHTHGPRGPYSRWARKHHFYHHFHNPSANHGVTSPIWDHVFGTYEEPGRIRVPEKHAMPWLVDDDPLEGRTVHERFRDDYEVLQKKRKHDAVPPPSGVRDQAPAESSAA